VKLACVVQRYGGGIAGGSEAHCRQLAERLSARHDITVLTTCARDYVTWENAFPPGASSENGVRVTRFSVARPRRLKEFADLSDEVFAGSASIDRQEAWFRANGPEAPALIDHLRDHGSSYDLVLFWAYRYYPTYFGLPMVADRSVLIPTAEEDPAIDLTVLYDYFQRPAGYLFLTPEEEALVSVRAGRALRPSAVIGIGLEPATAVPPLQKVARLARRGGPQSGPPSQHWLRRVAKRPDLGEGGEVGPYILYLGRVDRNKGCETLLEYFHDYAAGGGNATLVLAGPTTMEVPRHPHIRALGYVADEVRHALLAHARLLVVPSPYESLSLVLLEAWNMAVPALVNARCKVLAGQIVRADGGLTYRSALEFREALDYLLSQPAMRDVIGRQGRAYVEREYRWPTVLARVEKLLEEVRATR
jgi:glycosyltransferase involved in cell wall biosynthesis